MNQPEWVCPTITTAAWVEHSVKYCAARDAGRAGTLIWRPRECTRDGSHLSVFPSSGAANTPAEITLALNDAGVAGPSAGPPQTSLRPLARVYADTPNLVTRLNGVNIGVLLFEQGTENAGCLAW